MTTVYVQTDEDWCPSFQVEDENVRILQLTLTETFFAYRISVWGADDFGMELDNLSESDANKMYNDICRMSNVTREALKQLGFKYA